jgi:hypothetical protein
MGVTGGTSDNDEATQLRSYKDSASLAGTTSLCSATRFSVPREGVPLSDFWITSRTDAKDKGVDTRVGCNFLRFRDQSHHIQMGRLGKDASDFPNWDGRQMGLIWEKAPGM